MAPCCFARERIIEYPPIQIGDRVRTLRPLPRLPVGSIGTIAKIYGPNGLLDVLFDGGSVPRFVYRDQLDVLPAQEVENS